MMAKYGSSRANNYHLKSIYGWHVLMPLRHKKMLPHIQADADALVIGLYAMRTDFCYRRSLRGRMRTMMMIDGLFHLIDMRYF